MRRFLCVGAIVALTVMAGCGSNDSGGAVGDGTATTKAKADGGGGPSVAATEKEFSITLEPGTVTAGTVDFKLNNVGAIEHEFVVFKTDLAPDKLPVGADGKVVEDGPGVTHVDEQEHVKPKTPTDFKVDLEAGNYVVICNLPSHYTAGMHAALKVT